ncbi:hypothetical protein CCO02nite_29690 [Cellulomonas composti]|uniref:Uncharacterized protein n=1 Tax=Cellulomonas composti TaxID=266130 RepID=A0A511JEA2_9CELL|nr:hypothetical protein CCO02nite_29690 [Cellulomonas composti]
MLPGTTGYPVCRGNAVERRCSGATGCAAAIGGGTGATRASGDGTTAGGGGGTGAGTRDPHSAQNIAPGSSAAPHVGQVLTMPPDRVAPRRPGQHAARSRRQVPDPVTRTGDSGPSCASPGRA